MAKLVTKKAAVEDANKLTGPEKAAVILLALGEEQTALWERLDDDEVKEISQAMATLGNVSAEAVEVRGHLEGKVSCLAFTLRSSAIVTAEVNYETLVIESGAQIEGRFRLNHP